MNDRLRLTLSLLFSLLTLFLLVWLFLLSVYINLCPVVLLVTTVQFAFMCFMCLLVWYWLLPPISPPSPPLWPPLPPTHGPTSHPANVINVCRRVGVVAPSVITLRWCGRSKSYRAIKHFIEFTQAVRCWTVLVLFLHQSCINLVLVLYQSCISLVWWDRLESGLSCRPRRQHLF